MAVENRPPFFALYGLFSFAVILRHVFHRPCGTIKKKEGSENMIKKASALRYTLDGERLEIIPNGEIDHHNAVILRSQTDELINKSAPKLLVLNLEKINFMDSSGLGFIMGRYALMEKKGGKLVVKSPSKSVQKICRLAGLERMVKIEK